jgi:hypothetical protein
MLVTSSFLGLGRWEARPLIDATYPDTADSVEVNMAIYLQQR